jgi:uncharacterized protein YbgA (DUF1722 family)
MGLLKNHLSSEDRQELLGLIEDYRQGLLLIVPLTLLKHHLNRYPVPEWVAWVRQQVYLHPWPKELILRHHMWLGMGLLVPASLSGVADWGVIFTQQKSGCCV